MRANPRNAEARNALGLALGKSGQLNPAVARFREAVLDRTISAAWTNLGVALEQKGDLEGRARSHSQGGEPRRRRASYFARLSLHRQARRGHRRISPRGRLKPDSAETHTNVGFILAQLGDPSSMKSFEEAIKVKPDLAGPVTPAGNGKFLVGDFAAAIRLCARP